MSDFDELFQAATADYLPPDFDWRLLKAQGIAESNLDPYAESPAGAVGVMQFMGSTWNEWAEKAGYGGYDRTDPEASIMTGAAYLANLRKRWDWNRPEIDRLCLAFASYNAGLGNILKAQNLADMATPYATIAQHLPTVTGPKNSKETIGYVKRILSIYCDLVTG